MAGYRLVASGSPEAAKDTLFGALQNQGFTVDQTGEWTAKADRGSQGASVMLGAFAGKKGRHLTLMISCYTSEDGNLIIDLGQGTSGMSGGLIGMSQAKKAYQETYAALYTTFQSAGILVNAEPIGK